MESKEERASYPVTTSLCVLHNLDHSEIFTDLYREKKREEGDRGARRIKGGIKRRETDPVSNKFPKCSPLSGTHREVHRVTWRGEKGGGSYR